MKIELKSEIYKNNIKPIQTLIFLFVVDYFFLLIYTKYKKYYFLLYSSSI